MSEYYYLVAAIAYGIFVVQFILSWFGGDTELDVDFDGDPDMDVSDIVSFKGLIHFLMGASGWLWLREKFSGEVLWWDYLIALLCGVIFVIVLYYLYKLLMKLEHKPTGPRRGKDLVGQSAIIYICQGADDRLDFSYIVQIHDGFGFAELPAKSIVNYSVGDVVTVKDFIENNYII